MAVSSQDGNDSPGKDSPSGDKPVAWRMQHPERKYQLFPKDRQTAATPAKALDPEQAFALAMGKPGEKGEKSAAGTGLRIRIKDHNFIRRRKISGSDLGPLTTVQETPMDSPTIPGRPALHERSISAPGHWWKPYSSADCVAPTKAAHSTSGRPELRAAYKSNEELQRPLNEVRQPLSPKSLTPLVIPTTNSAAPRLARQVSFSRPRGANVPVETSARSATTDDSLRARTPFTPLSAVTTPGSAATTATTTSTIPTPVSAPIELGTSRPWEKPTDHAVVGGRGEGASEAAATAKTEVNDPTPNVDFGHRRYQSESASIMNRGRPRKLSEILGVAPLKRTGLTRSKSSERQAFEQLPKGWKANDAVNMLSPSEVAALQRQALQQAARFEVLRKEDVDNMSRELRQLDERTEYLRRTYTSLRAGRRNLHSRICQYLRSPRTAKFSHDAMLKQEEALAELDSSIDEWVNKLEQAENRRTRVRQKLLEHVAAATTLSIPTGSATNMSESFQHATGARPPNANMLSTPPRSPAKTSFTPTHASPSPSPQRVVAQVPSTIFEQPLIEDAATTASLEEVEVTMPLRRAETIHVYADDGVYALLADVEDAITEMGRGASSIKDAPLPDAERQKICRTHSYEALSGLSARKLPPILKPDEKALPPSPTLGLAHPSVQPAAEEIFLTSAVYKP